MYDNLIDALNIQNNKNIRPLFMAGFTYRERRR
jgi:hypothetical protein